ncbi:MAG: hypothetical protein ACRYG4_07480 [Janthinobacterium lividum]
MAHSPFNLADDGDVVFRRVVAASRLKVEDLFWNSEKFEQFEAKATLATQDIKRLVDEIIPYSPKLDFSDPRNSQYLAVLLRPF